MRTALQWCLLLGVPSVMTVLRYTAEHLNADGVQQSVMSVHGVSLFYWGQDRLVPVVSALASPISDPEANLWACLILQALSFYGLLAVIAHRSMAAVETGTRYAVPLCYLALVAGANLLFSSSAMHAFALEGQPYALSWLLAIAAYESWKKGGPFFWACSAAAAVAALGLNPSVVLLAGFLAVTRVVRDRKLWPWVGFVGLNAAAFLLWTYLAHRYAMYPTPEREPAPSYLAYGLTELRTGFSTAVSNVLAQLRAIPTLAIVLVALGATASLRSSTRARLSLYGAFFAMFVMAYIGLFAGNEWVLLNGFHFRYFFPLSLLILMATAIPITAAGLQLVAWAVESREVSQKWLLPAAGGLAVVCVAVSLAGPLRGPQEAPVLRKSQATEEFASTHDVRFLAGNYWNMWPLMHGLLESGRDGVFVTGFKSGGERSDYLRALSEEVSDDGSATALCINQDVEVCLQYLTFWTRPGWEVEESSTCPPPPVFGPADPADATRRSCDVLEFSEAA